MIRFIQTNYLKKQFFEDLTDQKLSDRVRYDDNLIELFPSKTKQSIIGFGGAFTESAAYVYHNSSIDVQKEILERYFGETGNKYNLGRVAINSCDFSLDSYTYMDEFDLSLTSFSIEREDLRVIPFIKDATRSGNSLTLMAAPWSPPAFMKTNSSMKNGGKLKKEYYELWANYLIKYLDEMKKRKIKLEFLSIQNEPEASQVWESCLYDPQDAIDFVKVLGPLIKNSAHKDIKLLLLDHNRDLIDKWTKTLVSNKEVLSYIWGIAIHWYVSEYFDALNLIKERLPTLHILFTEGCVEGGTRLGEVKTGERYARNIIGDFLNGCEGFIDWNLVLNEVGGPNHVGNHCDAPLIIKDEKLIINSSYYYIGHFSRYIKPNAKVIELMNKSNLKVLSCINTNGEIVVVVLNETDNDELFQLKVGSNRINGNSLAHTIQTWCINE